MDKKPTYEALKQRVKRLEDEAVGLKQTLQELHQSHDYLEKLIRYANAPIIVWDPKARITRFNPAFQHLTGHTADEVIGKKLGLLFPESSQDKSLSKISTALNGEYWKSVEIPILCKNGDIRITLWNSANICDEDGTTVLATIAQGQDITERKQSEEALRDSEDRFQKLLNSVNDVVWTADFNGKMLYINTAAEVVFGRPVSEFLKNPKTWITTVHPEDREEMLEQNNLLLDKGRVENKYRIVTKDGRIKWLVDKKSVVYDKTGNPVQIGGIATDITKQKIITEENIRITRALKLLSESNRIIVHSNEESQFLHDICKNIVEIGGYRLAWVGFAKQDRRKKVYPIAQYGFEDGFLDTLNITWADTEQDCEPAGTAIRENRSVICRQILADPDFSILGNEAVNRGCASAIALPIVLNDLPLGSLNIYAFEENGFGSDEVELLDKLARDFAFGIKTIRSREERRHAKQALKIEHGKLQSVLNGMGQSIYIVDKDLNIEFQNNIFIGCFGDHKGRKCYKSIFKLKYPCKDCMMHKTLRTNTTQHMETNLCSGKYYDLTFSSLKEDEETDKVIIFIRDITARKFFQAEAMRAGHLASLGELAAGVAHEINNPITGIITIAEVVLDQFHKMGGDVELPNLIIKEGERIGNIVNNLLSFARDREEEHSPVHINNIFNDTFALTQKQISKDGIHLSIAIPPDIPKIKARTREIQQVFLNIISNARYALNKKFPNPHVDKIFKVYVETVEIEEKMHVRIIFYDRGTGIPKDIMDKIRDPFFSTKPRGEGTGLGLSITHGIINSHEGKLWFESQEKKYTKVMIDLPVHNG